MRIKHGAVSLLTTSLYVLGAILGSVSHSNAAPPQSSSETPSKADAEIPNNYRINLLIRTTLIALTQANATGNYSVLRDLATPSFQQANNAARLAEIFASLRARKIDLSPILFFEPKLVRPPTIQANGHLRLSGYFETKPEQVKFDLAFERIGDEWRMFGIAVETSAPTPTSPGVSDSDQPAVTSRSIPPVTPPAGAPANSQQIAPSKKQPAKAK